MPRPRRSRSVRWRRRPGTAPLGGVGVAGHAVVPPARRRESRAGRRAPILQRVGKQLRLAAGKRAAAWTDRRTGRISRAAWRADEGSGILPFTYGDPTSPPPPAESREALLELLNEASSPHRAIPPRALPWEHLDTDSGWLPGRAPCRFSRRAGLRGAAPGAEAAPCPTTSSCICWKPACGLRACSSHRLGRALDTTPEVALRTRYLHEIREGGHSLFLGSLVRRPSDGCACPTPIASARGWRTASAGWCPSPHDLSGRGGDRRGRPDKLNRTVRPGADDVILSSRGVSHGHRASIDEARHIAHARASCEAQAARVARWENACWCRC